MYLSIIGRFVWVLRGLGVPALFVSGGGGGSLIFYVIRVFIYLRI